MKNLPLCSSKLAVRPASPSSALSSFIVIEALRLIVFSSPPTVTFILLSLIPRSLNFVDSFTAPPVLVSIFAPVRYAVLANCFILSSCVPFTAVVEAETVALFSFEDVVLFNA